MTSHAGRPAGTAPVVLVGYEDQPASRAAVATAADLAARVGASVQVVHAVPFDAPVTVDPSVLAGGAYAVGPPEDVREQQARAEEVVRPQVEELLAEHTGPWSLLVEVASAVDLLEEQAQAVDAYVVVVGARSSGVGAAVDRLLSGSTSKELERRARRPLLLVPEPDEAS